MCFSSFLPTPFTFVGVGVDNDKVLVLGATNLPWILDSAIRRRFVCAFFTSRIGPLFMCVGGRGGEEVLYFGLDFVATYFRYMSDLFLLNLLPLYNDREIFESVMYKTLFIVPLA